MPETKSITAGALDVGYLEDGPADGTPVILLHGFPYDVRAYDDVAPRLAAHGCRCITPYLRGYGPTRLREPAAFRSGQQAALGCDLLALLDALAIETATLAGYDWGGRAACVVAALWPERVRALVSCGTGYNIQDTTHATTPVAPEQEQRYWYWYYFNSERGRAALRQDRAGVCRRLWRCFSPDWAFDDATFTRTAAAFDNPDFLETVIHSYRYRIGEVAGEPHLAPLEHRLSEKPRITVPTLVLSGDADGVEPSAPDAKVAEHFTRLREIRRLPGVGHNVPQEAPAETARAVLDLLGA